jgi:LacI family transcriptional regulator, repressor for deo operon, udp, cdd, tsx, nupC, and nupG
MPHSIPTMKEIARRLNVSVSTVSRALQDHYSIGLTTKARVARLAKELSYEPNKMATQLKFKKTSTIGVIVPSFSSQYFTALINGIEDTVVKHNYHIQLYQSREEMSREKQLVMALKANRVDGMLISIARNTNNYEHLELLKKHNIPVVYLDRVPSMKDIYSITTNLMVATSEAIAFLLQKKHQQIALLNGPADLPASRERLAGYLTGHKKNGLAVNSDYIVQTDFSKAGTEQAMSRVMNLEQKPTAIIVFNDYVAMDAMKHAKRMNLRINEEISFVSFANDPFCEWMENPLLASIEQYPYLQGEQATTLLMDLVNSGKKFNRQERRILLPSRLVPHS